MKIYSYLLGITFCFISYLSNAQYQRQWSVLQPIRQLGGLGSIQTITDSSDYLYTYAGTATTSQTTGGAYLTKYDTSGAVLWQQLDTGQRACDLKYHEQSGFIYKLNGDIFTNSSYILSKLDLSGNTVWTRHDTILNHNLQGLTFDNNNDVIVYGRTIDSTAYNMHMTKYNASGYKVWSSTVLASNYSIGSKVIVDNQNSLYFGSGEYLSKFSANGTAGWSIQLDIFGFSDISFDNHNNLFVLGNTNSTHQMVVYKIDTAGNMLWSKTIGQADGYAGSIAFDDNNYAYVTGGASYSLNPANINSAVLAKFTASGDTVWVKSYDGDATVGSNNGSNWTSIKKVDSGKFLLWGAKFNDSTMNDGYLALIDTAGTVLWDDTYHINDSASMAQGWLSMSMTNSSDLYLAGSHGLKTGSNQNDIIIQKYKNLNPPVAGLHKINQKKKFKVFPNPANEFIKITGVDLPTEVIIYDVYGKRFYTSIIDSSTQIDISNLSQGVYFVSVKQAEYTMTQKVVITR